MGKNPTLPRFSKIDWEKLQLNIACQRTTLAIEAFRLLKTLKGRKISVSLVRWPIRTGPKMALGRSGRACPDGHIWSDLLHDCSFPIWAVPEHYFGCLNSQKTILGSLLAMKADVWHLDTSLWLQSNLGVKHKDASSSLREEPLWEQDQCYVGLPMP